MKRKLIKEYTTVILYCEQCNLPMKQYVKFSSQTDIIVFYRCENKHEIGIQYTDKLFGKV